ncbi:DgyrCDS8948 [Dimorphilus gyrociliatus]|uniref:DgyrCDS8948 n=1 Tax=Dimorphilus gyrociliatus TaxID=2664684 RepID=A0A7I8VXC5_9ANNE|nr:DgyrCDS8948 [Dimorphilus gyrociliatus]
MKYTYLLIALLSGVVFSNEECSESALECEYYFDIEYAKSMTFQGSKVYMANNSFMIYEKETGNLKILTNEEAEQVITADGRQKSLITINGRFPGPPIIVYEGQIVTVKLKNSLDSQGTSLHFHGIKQLNTAWMDGVGGVTQCPISPGQSFTYKFLASPVGTHWYHSHYGIQRSTGLFGPLVIKRKSDKDEKKYNKEFIISVHEWLWNDTSDIYDMASKEAVSFAFGYGDFNSPCFFSSKESDGIDTVVTPIYSALLNSRGRHYGRFNRTYPGPKLPLEEFHVESGGVYLFRIINTGMAVSFEISIDDHDLMVVATDGCDVRPKQFDSLIIHPGERYDFYLEAIREPGIYFLRARTLERFSNNKPVIPVHIEGLIKYKGSAKSFSKRKKCSRVYPCKVLNCPFATSIIDNWICTSIANLEALNERHIPHPTVEHFLNYHFNWLKDERVWKPTINGLRHENPSAPLQLFPPAELQSMRECGKENCNNSCKCTNILHLPFNKSVQLVLATTIHNPKNVLNGNPHPIHLHGHHFQVLSIGYPKYNEQGVYFKQNPSLKCSDMQCNRLLWSFNKTIISNPRAVEKDTVIVPAGGYVVIRFLTDNPGFWYMHCHMEFHNEEGMAMILQVGEMSDMTEPPIDMNNCGNFEWNDESFSNYIKNPPTLNSLLQKEEKTDKRKLIAVYVAAALATFSSFLALFALCHKRINKQYDGYQIIPMQ